MRQKLFSGWGDTPQDKLTGCTVWFFGIIAFVMIMGAITELIFK